MSTNEQWEKLLAGPLVELAQVKQSDRDIANELSQNLGTLAQDFRLLKGNGGLEAMKIFDEACLKRTEQLFARHRADELLAHLRESGLNEYIEAAEKLRAVAPHDASKPANQCERCIYDAAKAKLLAKGENDGTI